MFQRRGVEVKELMSIMSIHITREEDVGITRTLIVPSSVLATTTLSRASLARPVMQRSSFFLPVGRNRLAALAGHGPTL